MHTSQVLSRSLNCFINTRLIVDWEQVVILEQKYKKIGTNYNKLINKNKNLRKNSNKTQLKYNELVSTNEKLKK